MGPGAGCSITSAATVSTVGATGCFIRCTAFFTGTGLGFALAAVRFVAFADFAILRALPRLAEFPLRSLARFCTFDRVLRLAMIDPRSGCVSPRNDTTVQVEASYKTLVINRSQLERALGSVGDWLAAAETLSIHNR